MRKVLYVSLFILLYPHNHNAQNSSHIMMDTLALNKIKDNLSEAKSAEDIEGIAEALFQLGKLKNLNSKTKALDYFKEVNNLVLKTEDPIQQDLYYEQSLIYTTFSEFPEALKWGLKSLEFNRINKNEKKILRDMSHIGYIYDRMYDFRKSIDYNKDALKIAKRINDKIGEALCYGRIGIAYDELAEKDNFNLQLFDSALYFNKMAAELSESNRNLDLARTTYSNIGNTYSKLRQFSKAEEYTLKSLEVPGFEEKKGVTLVNLGKIYLETNRYREAKKILDSAMRNTLEYGTRKYQLEAYYRFHELDVKQGNYKSALSNYIEYKSIEDSLLNETKTRQIVEIGERYKTADKERQILIQRAEIAEQDLTIQKRNYQLSAAMGTLLILAIFAYLIYNQQQLRNRQLHKENQLKDALIKIETQNKLQDQRLRISRDLHDNIGAQLTFIISSIDNLKYGFDIQDENLNHKLDHISNFTTRTIHELRDTIWAMNKLEISLEDLVIRIQNYLKKAKDATFNETFILENNISSKENFVFSSIQGINCYRITQEAINNSIKYSYAQNILVKISSFEDNIHFVIQDDGKGFNYEEIELGNGLNNMKHRAEENNAELIINSQINKGTTVELKIKAHISSREA